MKFLFVFSFSCAIILAYLGSDTNNFKNESHALINTRVQSDNLIESWTKKIENFAFFSDGKFREIIVSGITRLEKNSDFIPDAHQTKKSLKVLDFEAEENKHYTTKHNTLKEAAKEIVTVIRASRHSHSATPVANASTQ